MTSLPHEAKELWIANNHIAAHVFISSRNRMVILLNCRERHTHESYKTTSTWENFYNQGTKLILFSYELWLTANNCKSFANGSSLAPYKTFFLSKEKERLFANAFNNCQFLYAPLIWCLLVKVPLTNLKIHSRPLSKLS